jgi:hypothetical protein
VSACPEKGDWLPNPAAPAAAVAGAGKVVSSTGASFIIPATAQAVYGEHTPMQRWRRKQTRTQRPVSVAEANMSGQRLSSLGGPQAAAAPGSAGGGLPRPAPTRVLRVLHHAQLHTAALAAGSCCCQLGCSQRCHTACEMCGAQVGGQARGVTSGVVEGGHSPLWCRGEDSAPTPHLPASPIPTLSQHGAMLEHKRTDRSCSRQARQGCWQAQAVRPWRLRWSVQASTARRSRPHLAAHSWARDPAGA